MTVKNFLSSYKKTNNIEKHIIKKYVPYAEKIITCDKIIKHTCYESISDKQVFKINTPLRQCLFLLSIIDIYTDIDIDWDDPLKDFDLLSEDGILGLIIKSIPESEFTLFSSILDMCIDDLITNTRDLVSFVESKLTAIEMVSNSIIEMLGQEDTKNAISNLLDNIG